MVNKPLHVVADENIPMAAECFAELGVVSTVNGRDLRSEQLMTADVLMVRSITQVNASLLEGTPVKFVGSATIGIDHIDTDYLQRSGIAWANAPGCNATSVVEYILSVFCRLDGVMEALFSGSTVGILGMGNVGSRLYRQLQALGINCVAYDPLLPLDQYPVLCDLEQFLAADVLCLHAPLTRTGQFPSWHFFNDEQLRQIKPGATLINAGRGGVVDNRALKRLLVERKDLQLVLDVWEDEPAIDSELLRLVDIATPHIAGYSFDGKMTGSRMVYEACCTFFGRQPDWQAGEEQRKTVIELTPVDEPVELLRQAILACYDVLDDDQRMREQLSESSVEQIARGFDQLRKNYPQRREFSHYVINNAGTLKGEQSQLLASLGFVL